MTIQSYLREKGFEITSEATGGVPDDKALDGLALLFCVQYEHIQLFLTKLRSDNDPAFEIQLTKAQFRATDIKLLENLCFIMEKNGILQWFNLDADRRVLSGEVTARADDRSRAWNFVTGGWLERSITFCTECFLNIDPDRMECLSNVHIKNPADPEVSDAEIDAILRVDETIYLWEAKSGQISTGHLDRFHSLIELLEIPPDHCFLVRGRKKQNPAVRSAIKRHGFRVVDPHAIACEIEMIEENANQS